MTDGDLHPPIEPDPDDTGSSGKPLVIGLLAVLVPIAVYFALGMPGMHHGGSGTAQMSSVAGHEMVSRVDPEEFGRLLEQPDVVLVNVHEPYEGEIDGTDAFLDYRMPDRSALPASLDTPLAVYCKTGDMSAIAVEKIHALGYTSVVELRGGMEAWLASGRRIIDRTKSSSG